MTERSSPRPNRSAARPASAGLVVACAALLASARPARADVTATCDFFEILAKQGDKPALDGDLKVLEKKLKKPPFASSWNQFHLLSRSQKTLAKKKAEPIALKNGSATATLVEIVDTSKVRLTVTMADDKGKQVNNTTTIEAADYVIYVQPLAGNEGHLLSVSCR